MWSAVTRQVTWGTGITGERQRALSAIPVSISCPNFTMFAFDLKKHLFWRQPHLLLCQGRSKQASFTPGVPGRWGIPLEAQSELRPNSGLFLSKHFERNQSDDDTEEQTGLSLCSETRLLKTQGLVQMNHGQSSPPNAFVSSNPINARAPKDTDHPPAVIEITSENGGRPKWAAEWGCTPFQSSCSSHW